jgi:hypothetical protein
LFYMLCFPVLFDLSFPSRDPESQDNQTHKQQLG